MKVLMIGPFPKPINGMSIANEMLLNGFSERGYDVEFVDTNTEKDFSDLKSQGKFNFKKVINSIKPILIGSYKILFKNFDSIYITPAQSYLGFMKYTIFIKLAKLKKRKCYIHFHGGYVRKMYDSVSTKRQIKLKKIFNSCDGVIVLGNSLKKMFNDIVPSNKIFVCENGVQKNFILQDDEFNIKLNKMKSLDVLNILYLSNLMETKGILDLMNACIELKEENQKFHLHLAGSIEPSIRVDIERLMNKLGDYVTYHNVVEGDEKRKLLNQSNIFCLPTYYPNEGQPISILEAMTMGNTIITTYQGGIIDIFKNGINGERCEAMNSQSIKKSIYNIKDNLEQYSINNFNTSKNKYTINDFIERVEKIIF